MWMAALHGVYNSYIADRDVPVLRVLFPIGDLTVLATALLIIGRAERAISTRAVVANRRDRVGDGHRHWLRQSRREWPISYGQSARSRLGCCVNRFRRRRTAEYSFPVAASTGICLVEFVDMAAVRSVVAGRHRRDRRSSCRVSSRSSCRSSWSLCVVRQAVAAWENRRLLAAAADQALRDPLTGLANRTLFHDRLTHAMMLRQRDERSVAVVSVDIDDFKLVNDSSGPPGCGHHSGQCRRAHHCLRPARRHRRTAGWRRVRPIARRAGGPLLPGGRPRR